MNEKIRVLVVEPMDLPQVREIDNRLKAMQGIVGGLIEPVPLYEDPEVCLVCNEEGKLLGLPYNRALKDRDGDIYDIVQGTFFLAGSRDGDMTSLSEEQIKAFTDLYSREMVLTVPELEQGGMHGMC